LVCSYRGDCPMDPIQAWKLQQARLGSKEKTLEELRSSQARWSVAFDMSDEDQDGLITESECSKAFKRILGANAEMPKYRLKEMFDEMDVLGKQRLDFRQFHKLAAELSQYMADNPKWAKEEEDKAEKEEKLKQQQLRERAKSDASDVFAILGIAKSKDVQETEQRKNLAVKQANEAKEMLKAAGQQVLEPKHARDSRGRRFTSDGTTSPTKKPTDDPGSPSARITSVTVNRRAGRTGGRRATVDPSADLPKLHLQGYGHACFALRFSPDDLQLAGAYLDGGLRIFDVARAQHLHTLNLSPRNLTRDEEKDDMEAAAEKAALERGKRLSKRGTAMLNLRWLSAGRTANIVATVDTAGTVGFWEVTRGGGVKILAEMPGESELGALSFSEGGDKLLVGGQERVVKVYDVEQLKSSKGRDMKEELCLGSKDAMVGDKPCRHSLKIMSLRSVPEHQHLFLSGGMDRSVLLWDLRTPKAPSAWISGVELSGDSLDISRDGNTVLAGSHRSLNPLQLFDLRLLKQADESEKKAGLTMTAVQTYQWSGDASEKAAQPSCMVFQAGWDSFDNTTIAAAGEKENQARIFERPKNGGPLRILSSLEGYSRAFYSASVSSDGRTAAFGSSDGSIVISNVRIM